ncbi:UDP-glucose 4-epimerase GalE [Basilea psittacipulmonis]|uniref:UDP-glucose 4-epimerase n=1 Tax=Basilea psittacipulmonis DSM 24701 TaxID=1072685 RepID=A0A077DDF6_9BURK|nr:UDP-glucose 4-epimerase GalE [Basilea psittacipulmonis]AIL32649.1 hypothetical protein IX83_04405 [Basilea psittacipulmonis DSM 24701]
MSKRILLTGGLGFIGSHTATCLLDKGYHVVLLDNLSNASPKVLKHLQALYPEKQNDLTFIQGDVRDQKVLDQLFETYQIDAVIHFAGLKAVGESVEKPILYYDNNVTGILVLLEAMKKAQVNEIVFSSSATVYGFSEVMPLHENLPTGNTTNPYGTSKYMVERILEDTQKAYPHLKVSVLRYFNPIGAHPSGMLGEDPKGIPNNLLPYISRVYAGRLPYLNVFGNDYPTIDGTGVRDYIHVMDLASGHLAALEHNPQAGFYVYNLGTGQGFSVLQIIQAFESVSQKPLPYKIQPRRAGDIATCYADASKAYRELNWQCRYTLADMMKHTLQWQHQYPAGYDEKE